MDTARSTLRRMAVSVGDCSSDPISLDERSVQAGCEYDQQHRNATKMETMVHKNKTGREVTVLMATTLDLFFIFVSNQNRMFIKEELGRGGEKGNGPFVLSSVHPVHLKRRTPRAPAPLY